MNTSRNEKKGWMKIFFPAMFFCLILNFNLLAQDDPQMDLDQEEGTSESYNDEELQQFAKAAEKLMTIQQETEQKMVQAIQEENIEIEKFNEILQSQQGQEADSIEASEEEMVSFNNAADKIMKIQTDVQTDMINVIESEGLEPQRYQEIMLAYQSDPEVKARIDSLITPQDQENEPAPDPDQK